MLYYAKKLAGAVEQREDMSVTPAIFQPQPEDAWSAQGLSQDTEQQGDEGEQLTLAAILQAVHRCTALVHTLQEQFGGLKEELGFIRHDLQKNRESTTAAEGRISDIEDKLTPLLRDTQITARIARANKLKSDDIENHLLRNNIRIVGLPEKTEGRDPTEFVERWLMEVFGKEVFYSVERAHKVPSRPLPPGHPPRTSQTA